MSDPRESEKKTIDAEMSGEQNETDRTISQTDEFPALVSDPEESEASEE